MITGSCPHSNMCLPGPNRLDQVLKKDFPSSLWRRLKQLSEKRWLKNPSFSLSHSLGVLEFIHVATAGNLSLSISLTPTDAHTQSIFYCSFCRNCPECMYAQHKPHCLPRRSNCQGALIARHMQQRQTGRNHGDDDCTEKQTQRFICQTR